MQVRVKVSGFEESDSHSCTVPEEKTFIPGIPILFRGEIAGKVFDELFFSLIYSEWLNRED